MEVYIGESDGGSSERPPVDFDGEDQEDVVQGVFDVLDVQIADRQGKLSRRAVSYTHLTLPTTSRV